MKNHHRFSNGKGVSSFLMLFQKLFSTSDFWKIFKVSESCFLICTTRTISSDVLGILCAVDTEQSFKMKKKKT